VNSVFPLFEKHMAQSDLRAGDMNQERILAEYLDEKLYSPSNGFTRAARTDDFGSQMLGSDIIISMPSIGLQDVVVDEKGQIHYANERGGLPTFAFELLFETSAVTVVEGWLTDESKITQYYLLTWITSKPNFSSKEEISIIEYALISRKKLLDYLGGCGLTKDVLREKSKAIFNSGVYGQIEKSNEKEYYYFNSTNLAEKPVNIIIRKGKLIELSEKHNFI